MTRELFGPVLTVYVYADEKYDEMVINIEAKLTFV